MSWNDEKVNKLKELWGKGNTASEIAQILGGVSRNAVIGKAHRLNLSGKIKSKKISVNSSRYSLISGLGPLNFATLLKKSITSLSATLP